MRILFKMSKVLKNIIENKTKLIKKNIGKNSIYIFYITDFNSYLIFTIDKIKELVLFK